MNDKLKDRILRLTNRLIVSLMLVTGMVCCGTLVVYGAEEGLTEEEVKQQVLEIIEEENQGEITDYTIVEYDIDKIYPIISLDFFVNDYIDGMTFEEIIEVQEKEYKKLNGEDNKYTYWHLPYNNYLKQKCIITFLADDETVEVVTRAVDTEIDYDMKLYEGKYEEILLKDVEKNIYLNLDLYGFKISYLCMNEGVEYIIPYLYKKNEKWTGLENEKIYSMDEFVTKLYNCYEEQKENGELLEKANLSSLVFERKRKLKCVNIEQVKKIEWIKENKIWIFIAFIMSMLGIYLIICLCKKKKM